ncbi:uncharacterized protein J3R85_013853 [Psidium guajava]|nr:uncharacterized protein J3R85_013853 [Psidium guajava]
MLVNRASYSISKLMLAKSALGRGSVGHYFARQQ